MNRILAILGYLWASPLTAFGLLWGLLCLCTGGRVQVVRGVLEFWGGVTRYILDRHLLARGAAAITLGHVIIGQTKADLDYAREHEHVHVKQYARWGIFMAPAYLGCSLYLWLRGKDPYMDNQLERESRGIR